MARLIDAEELQAMLNEVSTDLLSKPPLAKAAEHIVRACLMVTEMIQDAPTVDAEQVRHGRWIPVSREGAKCSACLRITRFIMDSPVDEEACKLICPYCNNCGAKMDLEG